jgi:hypothetical protein
MNGALKVRNIIASYYALSELHELFTRVTQGRRASLRSALAPGYHMPRLRRLPLTVIFRAFGAARLNSTFEAGRL